jgi:hypothetical protein
MSNVFGTTCDQLPTVLKAITRIRVFVFVGEKIRNDGFEVNCLRIRSG